VAVALVQSSTSGATDAQAASRTVPVPAGAAAGHVAVVTLEIWLNTSTDPVITWPAGFTQIAYVESSTDGFTRLYAAIKVLTGADSGTYSMSWSGSYWNQAQATLWSGVDNTTPLDVALNTAVTAANTTMPAVSLTTAHAGCGMLHVVSNENSASGTAPTGYTEQQEANYLRTNTKVAGAAGAETPAGGSISVSTVKLGLLVALRAAGSGASMDLALATEADSALAWSASKVTTGGLSLESDAARVIALTKASALGLPAEADTTSPVMLGKTSGLQAGAETDAARAMALGKTATLGLGTSAEIAQPMAFTKGLPLAAATETDASRTASFDVAGGGTPVNLATATEADTARTASLAKAWTGAAGAEADAAQALVVSKSWAALSASEGDQARPVSLSKGPALATATSVELARAMTFSKVAVFGRALETDVARAATIGAVTEYDAPTHWSLATAPGATARTRSTAFSATSRQAGYTATTRSDT
jgi:hypothetical protein